MSTGQPLGPKDRVETPFTKADRGGLCVEMLAQAATKGREEAKRKAEQEEAAKIAEAAALEAADKEDDMDVEEEGSEGGEK